MARAYKARNKRIIMRGHDGRFRKTTGADVGIGVCAVCQHLTVSVYDGDVNEPFLDPSKWRQRCYTCEPKTDAERAADKAKADASANQPSDFVKTIEEAAKAITRKNND